MKSKASILIVSFFILIACSGNIDNPYSPKSPPVKYPKLEFYEEPELYCPSYNPLAENQAVCLSYFIINNGETSTISFIEISLKIIEVDIERVIFEYQRVVREEALPPGWSFNGTLLFDVGTSIWDKYITKDAYEEVNIIGGN